MDNLHYIFHVGDKVYTYKYYITNNKSYCDINIYNLETKSESTLFSILMSYDDKVSAYINYDANCVLYEPSLNKAIFYLDVYYDKTDGYSNGYQKALSVDLESNSYMEYTYNGNYYLQPYTNILSDYLDAQNREYYFINYKGWGGEYGGVKFYKINLNTNIVTEIYNPKITISTDNTYEYVYDKYNNAFLGISTHHYSNGQYYKEIHYNSISGQYWTRKYRMYLNSEWENVWSVNFLTIYNGNLYAYSAYAKKNPIFVKSLLDNKDFINLKDFNNDSFIVLPLGTSGNLRNSYSRKVVLENQGYVVRTVLTNDTIRNVFIKFPERVISGISGGTYTIDCPCVQDTAHKANVQFTSTDKLIYLPLDATSINGTIKFS